jgi:hypothetical protein
MTKTPSRQSTNLDRPKIASRKELNKFLAKLVKSQTNVEDGEKQERGEAIRGFLQQVNREELRKLFARGFADALKSPSQKLGTAKPPSSEAAPAKKTKTAGQSKKRPGSNKSRSLRWRRGAGRSEEKT